jgi:endonuclease G, mitochondrial
MKKNYLALMLLSCTTFVFSQNSELLYPSEMPREQIIHHKSYSFSYNSSYVMPSWVVYSVTKSTVDKSKEPNGKYKTDPAINARPATKKDYKDAGYLMAQFVNYFDVADMEDALTETYYLSNITPMKLAFYTHVWLRTEDLIRLWVDGKPGFEVICGPVLTDAPFPTIGENKVSVPDRFYKIVYDKQNQKAVAFLFKNGSSSGTLKSRAITVDEIEKITGIDFFPSLDDEIETVLEATVDYNFWDFSLEEKL